MASLTVRQLDDKLKKLLRLRAARHSRSMEDEVRVILREAAEVALGVHVADVGQKGVGVDELFEGDVRPLAATLDEADPQP